MNKQFNYQFRITEELFKILNKLKSSFDAQYYFIHSGYEYITFKEDGSHLFSDESDIYDWSFPTKPNLEEMQDMVAQAFNFNNELLTRLFLKNFRPEKADKEYLELLKWDTQQKIVVKDGFYDIKIYLTDEF